MVEHIRPLFDRVLVKRFAQEEKTAGGIIIPDTAKEERTQMGKIVAVGAGRVTNDGKVIPVQVKVGDTVFFGKYAGTEASNEFVILKEEEILGIVE